MSSQERPETPAASAPEAGGVSPLITTHDDEPPRSTVSPVPPTPSSEGKRHLMGGRVTTVSSNGLPAGATAAAAAATAAGGETVELSSSYHWSFVSMTSSAVAGCGVSSKQGLRPSMEDQHTALLGTAPIPARTGEQIGVVQDGIPFFAVYDGHGGQRCAEFLRENLHYYVLSRENLKSDPEDAIKEGVRIAEQQFFEQEKTDESGSTAAMAMIIDNRLVIGNVGDTEIVLARDGHAHVMTKKHHPGTNLEEAKRVEGCGGRVFRGRVGHPFYNPALVSLAVSRAIGDAGFKREEFTNGRNSGITADADTCSTELTSTDEFFIIGCDGLWDVMNAEAAVRFCQQQLREGHDSQEITEALVNKAIDLGSKDNVTVLLVLLRRTLSPSQTHAAVLGTTLNGTTGGTAKAAAEASATLTAEEEEAARRLQLRKEQLLAAVAAASDKSAGLAPPAGATTNSVTPRVLAETGTYPTSARAPAADPDPSAAAAAASATGSADQ